MSLKNPECSESAYYSLSQELNEIEKTINSADTLSGVDSDSIIDLYRGASLKLDTMHRKVSDASKEGLLNEVEYNLLEDRIRDLEASIPPDNVNSEQSTCRCVIS